MKYRITVFDIASATTKDSDTDNLQEWCTGDWSCDCNRATLFSAGLGFGKVNFKECINKSYLVIMVRAINTNGEIGDIAVDESAIVNPVTMANVIQCLQKPGELSPNFNSMNGYYNSIARDIARSQFLLEKSQIEAMDKSVKDHPLRCEQLRIVQSIQGITGGNGQCIAPIVDFIAGNELETVKNILRQWDPEKLITAGQNDDEYDSYAKKFVEWAPKCNNAREFAVQIAARFNHMMCLVLNDNGVFEIIKPQTYTADSCLTIAGKIRKACGVSDMLPRVEGYPRTTGLGKWVNKTVWVM